MLPVQLFYAILAFCCFYAAIKGGAPERLGAGIFGFSSLLSTAAVSGPAARFGSVEFGVLAVDITMLLALVALAICAQRFWPLWVAALQAIGTAGHAVKLADPDLLRWGYAFALAFWSYPMLLLLVVGTWNHQRRLARHGADKSWSTSSLRWGRGRRTGPTA